MLVLGSVFNNFPTSLYSNTNWQETKTSSAKKVASYQLSEDRAAMALAWDAPPDAVGADTVTLAKIGRRIGSDGSDGSGEIWWQLRISPKLDWWKVRKSSQNMCIIICPDEWKEVKLFNFKGLSEAAEVVGWSKPVKLLLVKWIGKIQTTSDICI